MTRRREVEHHRQSLNEIREIMNSMKTLAYMETRKLTKYLPAQTAIVKTIENAAEDFLCYFPQVLPIEQDTQPVFILIGTERGFCGDFNQSLIQQFEESQDQSSKFKPHLIAVGQKLHPLAQAIDPSCYLLSGASVVEEVGSVIGLLADTLNGIQVASPNLSLFTIYHAIDSGIAIEKILPPFQAIRDRQRKPLYTHPPLINLQPEEFFLGLAEQFLFAVLHELIYLSLMAENQQRVSHLQSAVQHLDDESEELQRKVNALRQEEIIEEIEVILLNTNSLDSNRM